MEEINSELSGVGAPRLSLLVFSLHLGPNKESKQRYCSSSFDCCWWGGGGGMWRKVDQLWGLGGFSAAWQEAAGQSLNNKWVSQRIWLIIPGRRCPGTTGPMGWREGEGNPALEPQTPGLINGGRKWKASGNNYIIKVPLGEEKHNFCSHRHKSWAVGVHEPFCEQVHALLIKHTGSLCVWLGPAQ